MTTNEFTISAVPIKIEAVTPISVLSSYNGFNEYVNSVQFSYAFHFNDITAIDTFGDDNSTIRMAVKLTANITDNNTFTEFKPFDELTKEDFYPLGIVLANNSLDILKTVKFIRTRTGLDIEPPRTLPSLRKITKLVPFK